MANQLRRSNHSEDDLSVGAGLEPAMILAESSLPQQKELPRRPRPLSIRKSQLQRPKSVMMSQTIKSIAPPLPTCPHHEFSKAQLTKIPSHLLNEKLLRSRANLSPS